MLTDVLMPQRLVAIDFYMRPDSLRFMVGRSWWFSTTRATQDFGYSPTAHGAAILAMKGHREKKDT